MSLGKLNDSSETRAVARLPTQQSVHAVKALRSPTELAIARGTTKPDSEKVIVVTVELSNSAVRRRRPHAEQRME